MKQENSKPHPIHDFLIRQWVLYDIINNNNLYEIECGEWTELEHAPWKLSIFEKLKETELAPSPRKFEPKAE